MSYTHQDWETVVIRKVKSEFEKKQDAFGQGVRKAAPAQTQSTASAKPAWKIEKMVDDPDGKKPLEFVKKEDAQRIIQARVALKMTQKDLAHKLNMNEKDIKDIEQCKAVENKIVLGKIKRFLHIS